MSVKIAPSILSADFARMGDTVSKLASWGADWVHCDVMDGHFVPNITFGMPMVKAIRRFTQLPLDVHLMIDAPEHYALRFIEAGANVVTFHAETCADVAATLKSIRDAGAKCGLVLNPDRAVEEVTPWLNDLDVVMLMGVFPGFGGQKFIPDVMDKIGRLKDLIKLRGAHALIELDGGVTLENASEMRARGVDVLVGGKSVFSAVSPSAAIAALRGKGR